ncbi:hypothetical protein GXG31_08015 [Escherichia coli]|nr:hypothetical protein [Escherichia coli]EFI4668850.1 hypothetical protein [Escherichia coli]EFI5974239.1 hypothetical protein [Escherichia coli]
MYISRRQRLCHYGSWKTMKMCFLELKNYRIKIMPISFYECCYEFLPRAQPQDKIFGK